MKYCRYFFLLWIAGNLYCHYSYKFNEDDETYFSPDNHNPFSQRSQDEACGEPVYCSHTEEFQKRLMHWQNPPLSECSNSKFLIYEPPSEENGIGSMIQIIGSAFRQAMCLGRILYLNPGKFESKTLSRWMYPACDNSSSTVECYFERITSCTLSFEEIYSAHVSQGSMRRT